MKKTIAALFLIIASILCYYVPWELVEIKTVVDIKNIPINQVKASYLSDQFYLYYCYVVLFDFALITLYSLYLFISTDIKHWKTKLLFSFCFIGEFFTLLNYIISKKIFYNFGNNLEYYISLGVISIIFAYFLRLVFTKEESDEFDVERTYLVKYKPKNYIGLLNYIFNRTGHFAIYQDGYRYSFKNNYLKKELMTKETIEKMKELAVLKLIAYTDIEKRVGTKYSLFRYNCLHLRKEALG